MVRVTIMCGSCNHDVWFVAMVSGTVVMVTLFSSHGYFVGSHGYIVC